MLIFAMAALLLGAVLGLRFKVLILLPAAVVCRCNYDRCRLNRTHRLIGDRRRRRLGAGRTANGLSCWRNRRWFDGVGPAVRSTLAGICQFDWQIDDTLTLTLD